MGVPCREGALFFFSAVCSVLSARGLACFFFAGRFSSRGRVNREGRRGVTCSAAPFFLAKTQNLFCTFLFRFARYIGPFFYDSFTSLSI